MKNTCVFIKNTRVFRTWIFSYIYTKYACFFLCLSFWKLIDKTRVFWGVYLYKHWFYTRVFETRVFYHDENWWVKTRVFYSIYLYKHWFYTCVLETCVFCGVYFLKKINGWKTCVFLWKTRVFRTWNFFYLIYMKHTCFFHCLSLWRLIWKKTRVFLDICINLICMKYKCFSLFVGF